jgi:hypothetical protein
MIHVPADRVDRWVNDEWLKKDRELHDLVATGRSADGSFLAHHRVIIQIIEMTDSQLNIAGAGREELPVFRLRATEATAEAYRTADEHREFIEDIRLRTPWTPFGEDGARAHDRAARVRDIAAAWTRAAIACNAVSTHTHNLWFEAQLEEEAYWRERRRKGM